MTITEMVPPSEYSIEFDIECGRFYQVWVVPYPGLKWRRGLSFVLESFIGHLGRLGHLKGWTAPEVSYGAKYGAEGMFFRRVTLRGVISGQLEGETRESALERRREVFDLAVLLGMYFKSETVDVYSEGTLTRYTQNEESEPDIITAINSTS